MPAKLSDEAITKMVLAGDADAFETLVHKYQGAVLGVAYNLVGNFADAEDLAQETFISAFLSLHQLNDHSKFASWLRQITVNVCRMWLRHQRKAGAVPLEQFFIGEMTGAYSTQPAIPGIESGHMELHDAIRKINESLPEQSRLIVTLRDVDGLTYREIADFLELPVSTVKWRLYEARRKLRKEMIDMAGEVQEQHSEELQERKRRKMLDSVMEGFSRMCHRIAAADKGHLYLGHRHVHQPGDAQWVKMIWDEPNRPDEIMITNQRFWALATEADDAAIKSEKGNREKWRSATYVYLRKKQNGGPPSDSVDIYGFNTTQGGCPVDEDGNIRVQSKPVNLEKTILDKLETRGFAAIGQKKVPQFRIGSRWAAEERFQKVTQYQFRDKDGRDIYFEIAIPSTDEAFLEFIPERECSMPQSGTAYTFYKIWVLYPCVEKDTAITAVWAHWGQCISINAPLNFPIRPGERDMQEAEHILDTAKSVESFFHVIAEYLGYSEATAVKHKRHEAINWGEWRDWVQRRRELHPITEEKRKELDEQTKETPWTASYRGLTEAFYDAKRNSQPTAPPQNVSIDDVGKVDLSEGFREISRGRKEVSLFGALSLDMPENSVQIEYRGPRGKKITVDLLRFGSDLEAGDFYWQTKPQNKSFAFNDDATPFTAFRSPLALHRHVNAIWADGVWLINIRIPITKPGKKKWKQNLLPEEELREAVAKALLNHFANHSIES